MTVVVIIIHTIIAILLGVVILMQSGRGGGLTEMAAGAESMFGAQTNAFMVRATTILSVIFLVTSLSLAIMSSKSGKSIMPQKVAAPVLPTDFMEEESAIPETTDVSEEIITNPVTSEQLPDVDKSL